MRYPIRQSLIPVLILGLLGFAPLPVSAKDKVIVQINARVTEGAIIVKVGGVEVNRIPLEPDAPFMVHASGEAGSLMGHGRDAPSGPDTSVNMYTNLEGFIDGNTVRLEGEVTKSTAEPSNVGLPITIEADLSTNWVTWTFRPPVPPPVEVLVEFVAYAHIVVR